MPRKRGRLRPHRSESLHHASPAVLTLLPTRAPLLIPSSLSPCMLPCLPSFSKSYVASLSIPGVPTLDFPRYSPATPAAPLTDRSFAGSRVEHPHRCRGLLACFAWVCRRDYPQPPSSRGLEVGGDWPRKGPPWRRCLARGQGTRGSGGRGTPPPPGRAPGPGAFRVLLLTPPDRLSLPPTNRPRRQPDLSPLSSATPAGDYPNSVLWLTS